MKQSIIFFGLILLASSVFAQIVKPVKWEFESQQLNNGEVELNFIAKIEQGWHLYDTSLPEGGPVATSINYADSSDFEFIEKLESTPTPTEIFDPSFKLQLRYFSNKVTFKQKIKPSNNISVINGYVEFMSCNDKTCTPPGEAEFSFKLNTNNKPLEATTAEKTTTLLTDKGKEGSSETLWLFFFFSFIAGLAAILTPCVFPMIPMTVSFFMHSSKSKLRSRLSAIFYGLSIIIIYTIIGTIVAVIFGPDIANWLSTHWIPNLLFFLVFMIFAFSFFGMYEIVLPGWLVNKSDQQADKGGFAGAFFMALTLVLVSFSCTGPIVGAILVESAGGQILKPIVGMFGFSLAFALPFTLFALFPGWLKNLPKSGSWLNSVKVVLGFLELALGFKFLSIVDQTYHWEILNRNVYLIIWIIIFALLGIYLLGKIKFPHDSKTKRITFPRLILAFISFGFVAYLITGLSGAPLKTISGYLPPQYSQSNDKIDSLCEKPKYSDFLRLPHGLKGYFDYQQGLACAKAQDKPVFIDFTGHGCVNCREMEANVWSDQRVQQRLRDNYVIIALYVDDKKKLPEQEWIVSDYDGKTKKTLGKKNADFQISQYGINAQPYYVLLDHEGKILTTPKAYDLDPDHFVDFLDEGLKKFKGNNH